MGADSETRFVHHWVKNERWGRQKKRLRQSGAGATLPPELRGGCMTELATTKSRREATGRLLADNGPLPFVLLGAAAGGWWLTARMTHAMVAGHSTTMSMGSTSLSFIAFLGGWVAMMGAMMFPAIVPVVLIFRRAAGRGQVAPTPYFIAGYLMVWSTAGVPAYVAWRALRGPLSAGAPLAGRIAGAIFSWRRPTNSRRSRRPVFGTVGPPCLFFSSNVTIYVVPAVPLGPAWRTAWRASGAVGHSWPSSSHSARCS